VSAILDALRRGRVRHAVRSTSHATDTAAVLQTMGCRHMTAEPALNQRRRIIGYFLMIVVLAFFLWLLSNF
jgi:hypothetical protein